MNSFFKKSVELNLKIEKFLDTISNSLTLFESAMSHYLEDDTATYKDHMLRINDLESEADELEKEIKVSLYKYMLLPDTRLMSFPWLKAWMTLLTWLRKSRRTFTFKNQIFPPVFTRIFSI